MNILTYVNRRCNMACPYCYDARPRDGAEFREALLPAYFDLCERLDAGGEPLRIMLAGGEPSLSPGLVAKILAGAPERARFVIMTNAFDVSGGFARAVALRKEHSVVVASYDGLFQERRRAGSAERVRANIRELRAAGFHVRVCWTVTPDTAERLFDNALHLFDVCPDVFIKRPCGHNVWGGNAAYVSGFADNLDKLVDLCALRAARGCFAQLPNRIERGRDLSCAHRRGTFSCHTAFEDNVVVDVDGRIYPCESFVTAGRHALGNLARGCDPAANRVFARAAYPGAQVHHTVCPYWNEMRNNDFHDTRGCLNEAVDSLLFAARGKYQGLADRLKRLAVSSGNGVGRPGGRARQGERMLHATTDNLHDPIIQLYEALFRGEKALSLRLTVKPGFRPDLLEDFLSLAREGERDFNARIELEVADDARILQ